MKLPRFQRRYLWSILGTTLVLAAFIVIVAAGFHIKGLPSQPFACDEFDCADPIYDLRNYYAAATGGYFILAFIASAGLGLGDVKFAAVIGLTLGWFRWSHVAIGTLLAFLFNGIFALIVPIRRRKPKGSEVPVGPSMVRGPTVALVISV